MRVLDLFSGIGGFSLGLEAAGFETAAFCEISPKCRHLLRHHWPEVPIYDDICTLTAERLAADGIAVDAICGGFPCQDISFAGAGAGIEGERSGLWREYARLIGELRPAIVIVENVAALTSRGLGVVLGDLALLGFDAEWDRIRAADVGAPHLRARLWIVAYSRGVEHQGFGDAFRRALAAGLSEAYCVNTGLCAGDYPEADAQHPDADYAGSHRAEEHLERGPELRHEQDRLAGSLGQALPDTDGERLEGCGLSEIGRDEIPDALRCGSRSRWARARSGRWWATEPDVGRVAHGVPAELDGVHGDGATEEHDQESGPQGDGGSGRLPSLRRGGTAGAASSGLQQAESDRGSLSAVPCEGGPAGRDAEGQGGEVLHDLRDRVPADAQQEAHDLQSGLSRRSRSTQRAEAMGWWAAEPDVPRVAHGVPARVDRLHGLGNAVVPEIPYRLGCAIIAARAAA